MSFQAMTWAVKQKVGNATGKAILLMLANYADQDGVCFPSQEKLAQECECTRQTVSRFLGDFEKRGLIVRVERRRQDGYRTSDEISLNFDYCADGKDGAPADKSCNNSLRKNISRKKFLRKNESDLMSKDVTAITYQDNHQYIISQEPIGSFEINMFDLQAEENFVEDLDNLEPPPRQEPDNDERQQAQTEPECVEVEDLGNPPQASQPKSTQALPNFKLEPTHVPDDRPPERAKSSTKPPSRANLKAQKAELEREFEEVFWPQVVRKVAKAAALKAFPKARQKASLAQIMAGLGRYQAGLIAAGTDKKFWLHPATFLNGERWADEPDPISTNRQDNNHEQRYQTTRGQGKSVGEQVADLWIDISENRQSGKEAGLRVSDDFLSRTRINAERAGLLEWGDCGGFKAAFINPRPASHCAFA